MLESKSVRVPMRGLDQSRVQLVATAITFQSRGDFGYNACLAQFSQFQPTLILVRDPDRAI